MDLSVSAEANAALDATRECSRSHSHSRSHSRSHPHSHSHSRSLSGWTWAYLPRRKQLLTQSENADDSPLLSEHGTLKTVNAKFRPWLSCKAPEFVLRCSRFARTWRRCRRRPRTRGLRRRSLRIITSSQTKPSTLPLTPLNKLMNILSMGIVQVMKLTTLFCFKNHRSFKFINADAGRCVAFKLQTGVETFIHLW